VGSIEQYSSIANCYATGTVSGSNSNSFAGGLVGNSNINSPITNCYATGAITSIGLVGGIAGTVNGSTKTENCAALNPSVVSSNSLGRVAGQFVSGSTGNNNVAWEGMLLNNALITDGLHNNINGKDISSEGAQDEDTYKGLGWKFGEDDDNPWKMGVGAYPLPVFYWQNTAPTANVEHLNN
jgi:hypothetical protein